MYFKMEGIYNGRFLEMLYIFDKLGNETTDRK